jgi:hypothetical protein
MLFGLHSGDTRVSLQSVPWFVVRWRGRPVVAPFKRCGWRAWRTGAAASCLLPFIAGCAGTVDTLTSQRFRDSPFHTLFHSDDPVYVLRNVQEGDDRAKAMLLVKEPKKNGKSDEEQTEIIQILGSSATSDKQLYCRLNAIEALSRFDDPRSASILVTAYRNANQDVPLESPAAVDGVALAGHKVRSPLSPVTSFTPENIITIQCRALEALGKKRTPEAFSLLCEVATTPPKKDVKATEFDALSQGSLGQDQTELRLAAIRALENYKKDAQAARVLYQIMTTERALVEIKSRAHLSLMAVTDKDYEPMSPEWAALVKTGVR